MIATIVASVLVVASLAIGGVVVLTRLDDSDTASGPHASAIESPSLSADCAECLPEIIDELVEVVGGPQVVVVYVFDHLVLVEAPTTPGAETLEAFEWRDGKVSRGGRAGDYTFESVDDLTFDITSVDWTLVEGLKAQVPELTGIDDRTPIIAVAGTDGLFDDEPRFSCETSDDGHYGRVTWDMDGQVVEMHGGRPGSPASEWKD